MSMTPTRSSTSLPRFSVAAAGAVLFGAGLAAGAWLYMWKLAEHPGQTGLTAGAIAWNVSLFSGFALHHSVMARSGAKAWLARHIEASSERSVFVWVASLLFLGVCAAWIPTNGVAWTLEGPWAGLGYGVQLLGLLVTALGARILDIWELVGLRQVLAPRPVRMGRASSEPLDIISDRGPYGLVRHPIYFGWLLLTWPTPTMTSGRLLFSIVSTLYLLIAIPLEERTLVALHGDEYRRYQRQVRSRLLPGIY